MDYLSVVQKHIPLILTKVRENIINNPSVYSFIKNKDEINSLLDKQEELITKYLVNFDKKEFDENFCYKFYKDLDIPYAIIFASLNFIKKEIVFLLNSSEIDKEEIIKFNIFFDKFINLAAKVYLKKDIQSLKKIKDSQFKNYLLYKAILEYVDKIIVSVVEENLDNFPLISSKECKFAEYLYYPESLMVCIDKNLCGYLEELHSLIHKSVNSFYMFYVKETYSEAYFIFKDFKEQILKLLGIISELYFVTYSDVEKSFFKLAALLEPDEDIYITMIDFKNLKGLNGIYGEMTVTEALKTIEKRLQKYFSRDMKRSLLIKGLTANFYILNVKCSKKEYKNMIENIFEIMNMALVDSKIILSPLIVGINIERYSQFKDFEFIKMLQILKNEAKKEGRDILLAIEKEEKEKLEKAFYNKYTKQFLKERLDNGDIEVVFQAIYHTENNELYSLEALGRIKDGEKLVSSGIFIDEIYEMGMIDKFDMLILKRIIEKIPKIKKITKRLFINVSFNSLLNEEYIKLLNHLINSTKELEIILELTEQKFIENLDIVSDIHQKNKVFFAIDDFGSGYSSLKTVIDLVKRNILKVLKIDGSLVVDMKDDEYLRKIVKIISQIGQEFYILTVAEFVENEKVLEYLKNLKVNLAQGYYLSLPKTIEELMIEKAEKFRF
jgi:EAL domain-containing protein (putative c-di-GMP-specific phosphodiesterase class I)/GGDEF domain-containing protein